MGCAAALLFAFPALAQQQQQPGLPPFPQWLETFRAEARSQGISDATLAAALPDTLKPLDRVVELDRKQPEFKLTYEQYINRVINDQRVANGRARLRENRALLEKIAERYGVQPRFIVALWGIETNYGQLTGGFNVVPALATLAWEGRRADYFRRELVNALKIVDQGHIPLSRFSGSWAGAMGQCQFMPSSFLSYAQDFDGDGHKDIWQNRADVFASIANYLKQQGWNGQQTWGRPVRLPDGFNRDLIGLETKKSLADWQKLGVRAMDGKALPKLDMQASLIHPTDSGGPVYLVYDNFRAILHWNRSRLFGLAVGQLADRIGQ